MGMFITQLIQDPFFYFSWVLVVMFSVTLHEFAHARAAYGAGDDTAWLLGHGSFNPLVQMGPPSLVMLALFGVAWGAVPISRSQLRDPKARAWVAFAGPLTNLLLLVIFTGLSGAIETWWLRGVRSPVGRFMSVGGAANAMLFLLNMLPIPVLDGWEVFSLFFPRWRHISMVQAQQVSWIAILVLFLTPVGDVIWRGAFALHRAFQTLWSLVFALF